MDIIITEWKSENLKNLGYISGEFITQYNFQTRKISSPEAELFISQISEDRTEIRINSTVISSTELLNYGNKLIDELDKSIEQRYFLLNLINNTQFLVVNVAGTSFSIFFSNEYP